LTLVATSERQPSIGFVVFSIGFLVVLMIDVIDIHGFDSYYIDVKILLWTCMITEFKEFQGEILCGSEFSECIDVWMSVRRYHDTLITIHT